jgi:hypothetical protein
MCPLQQHKMKMKALHEIVMTANPVLFFWLPQPCWNYSGRFQEPRIDFAAIVDSN